MRNAHAPMVNLSEVEQDSETFGELGDYGYPSQSILIKLSIKQAAVEAFLTDFLAVVSHCIHSNWFSSGQFLRGVISNSFEVSRFHVFTCRILGERSATLPPSHRSTHRGALGMRGAPPGSAPMHYLRTHARQCTTTKADRQTDPTEDALSGCHC